MRYMLLIYAPESKWDALPEGEKGKIFQEYMEFTESIRKSGHYVAGDPLHPTKRSRRFL
jgi:hypothetical protein